MRQGHSRLCVFARLELNLCPGRFFLNEGGFMVAGASCLLMTGVWRQLFVAFLWNVMAFLIAS